MVMGFLHHIVPVEVAVIAKYVEGGSIGHHDDGNAAITRHEGGPEAARIAITGGEFVPPEAIVVDERLVSSGQAAITAVLLHGSGQD